MKRKYNIFSRDEKDIGNNDNNIYQSILKTIGRYIAAGTILTILMGPKAEPIEKNYEQKTMNNLKITDCTGTNVAAFLLTPPEDSIFCHVETYDDIDSKHLKYTILIGPNQRKDDFPLSSVQEGKLPQIDKIPNGVTDNEAKKAVELTKKNLGIVKIDDLKNYFKDMEKIFGEKPEDEEEKIKIFNMDDKYYFGFRKWAKYSILNGLETKKSEQDYKIIIDFEL